MARIRTIKPGFFLDDKLAELSPLHRLAFIGLWTLADREGRLEDRPKRIKAELFPWDDADPGAILNDLDRLRFIQRYVAEAGCFIAIPGFTKHQRPHPHEPQSEIPEPPSRDKVMPSRDKVSNFVLTPETPSYTPETPSQSPEIHPAPERRVARLPDSRFEGTPDFGSMTRATAAPGMYAVRAGRLGDGPKIPVEVQAVFDHWVTARGRTKGMKLDPSTKSGKERCKLIAESLRSYSQEQLCKAIDGVALDPWPERVNQDGLKIILRPDNIDKFLALAEHGPPRPPVDVRKGHVRAEDNDWSTETARRVV